MELEIEKELKNESKKNNSNFISDFSNADFNFNMIKKNYDLGGGTLYMFGPKEGWQAMGYAIKTKGNKVIFIDGGNEQPKSEKYLYNLIKFLGGRVNAWFITHPHSDHFGALTNCLLNENYDFSIDCIYYNFPNDDEWLRTTENNQNSINYTLLKMFFNGIEKRNIKTHILKEHETFDYGVKFTVLNNLNNYKNYHTINDISIVIKAEFPKKSVLFLADIGLAAEEDLIKSSKDLLKSDIVQMAHHGQGAVDEKLYKMINPKIALWDTPSWLWENDSGDGKNSGPWTTLITRKWMEEIGVTENLVTAFGDYEII